MSDSQNGRVDLARLSEQLNAIAANQKRFETELKENRAQRDSELKEIRVEMRNFKKDFYALKEQIIEERGGKKLLYGLLIAAMGIGAGLSEMAQKFLQAIK